MPYFKWKGIDIQGKDRHGTMFARSAKHLDVLLFKREIALMSQHPIKPLFKGPIRLDVKIHFFSRLATLLEAGVHLPQSLSIMAESMEHAAAQEVIAGIYERVEAGQAFHEACACYPRVFNNTMIHMINVGLEAGSLPLALTMLTMHFRTTHQFYKKIRLAALVPGFTLLFFIAIMFIIFIVVMPLFSTIFESFEQEMPPLTGWLMRASNFLSSPQAVLSGLGLIGIIFLIYHWIGKNRRKRLFDVLVIKMPLLSDLVEMTSCFSFFQTVSMLLDGGMRLVPALYMGRQAINNEIIRAQVSPIVNAVASGSSLSASLVQYRGPFSRSDIEAMIMVGQESGQLPKMLSQIADDYKQRTERKLAFLSALFQPIVMIVLGVFIALLIVAVYIPILSLSSSIS